MTGPSSTFVVGFKVSDLFLGLALAFRFNVLASGKALVVVSSRFFPFTSCTGEPKQSSTDVEAGSSGMNGAVAFSVIVCGFFLGNFGFAELAADK